MLYPDIYLGFWLLEHCPVFFFFFFLLKTFLQNIVFVFFLNSCGGGVLGLHICSYTFEQINVHKGERFLFHFSWTLTFSH